MKKQTLTGINLGRSGKRFLIIYKSKSEWRWKVQTALPPKVGDKIANGCQGYSRRIDCTKMAFSIVKGNITPVNIPELKNKNITYIYEIN